VLPKSVSLLLLTIYIKKIWHRVASSINHLKKKNIWHLRAGYPASNLKRFLKQGATRIIVLLLEKNHSCEITKFFKEISFDCARNRNTENMAVQTFLCLSALAAASGLRLGSLPSLPQAASAISRHAGVRCGFEVTQPNQHDGRCAFDARIATATDRLTDALPSQIRIGGLRGSESDRRARCVQLVRPLACCLAVGAGRLTAWVGLFVGTGIPHC